MTTINLDEFQGLCRVAWEQKARVEELQRELSTANDLLDDMKAKVLAYMESVDIEKQHVSGFGTLSILNRFSVKVPQGDAKLAFFEYLEKRELFKTLATVNSQTLNAWYKESIEEAINRGDSDFKVPGIEEPKVSKTISFRKG